MRADDLDSGYWHLGIHPDHYKYLGIHIPEEDGSTSFYFWRVLFLGVSDAVFIFSVILKPIVVFLHTLGHRVSMYIDDLLTVGDSLESAVESNRVACDALAKAGWVTKPDQKTGPAQRLQYLGLEICFSTMKFFIPKKKLEKLLLQLAAAVNAPPHFKVRSVASTIGLLMSCSRALGPVTRIMSRNNYAWINLALQETIWDGFAAYTSECRKEFNFCKIILKV